MPLPHNTAKYLLFIMVLLTLPTAAVAGSLVPSDAQSRAKPSPAHISPNNPSQERLSPTTLPPGRLSSGEISQPYGGLLSISQSTAQVQTQAQLEVHTNVLRQLAHEPIIQYIKTVTSTFSPPDVHGLIYYLYDFPFTYLVDPTTKTVTGTVQAVPQFTDLRQAVLDSLQKRTLMERYGAIHTAQKASLYSLKSSPGPALASSPPSALKEQPRPTEDISTVKAPSIPADAGQPAPVSSAPASPPPSAQAQHANTLITLLKYQEMLRHLDGQWESPQDILAQLTELERLTPHNPLVQGALAEVLLQLKRPQQAQHHSDTAVATAKKHAYLYDTRGEIFLQLQLPSLATEAFTKAIELDNHNPIFFLHRATSYLPRNKTNSMCQDFNQACLLGDCSGYQWAFEQEFCQHDETAPLEKPSPSKAPSPSAEDFLPHETAP